MDESYVHEAKVWKTLVITGGVVLCVLFSSASYCGMKVGENYRVRANACIEAKGTWIPNSGDGVCLAR